MRIGFMAVRSVWLTVLEGRREQAVGAGGDSPEQFLLSALEVWISGEK
jgi:hypothetical protein